MSRVQFHAFSQRGVGKVHNEDALFLDGTVCQGSVVQEGFVDSSEARWFAIADGVTASTQPRRASRTLLDLLSQMQADSNDTAPISAFLRDLQYRYAAFGADARYRGMASTLVGVRISGNVVTVFNVGDSRAYLLRSGHARLLSRDHSVLNDLIDEGEVSAADAPEAASFLRALTSQFVADPELDGFAIHSVSYTWFKEEKLLLCSDGLTEALSDHEIAALLEGGANPDLRGVYLAARKAGARDDISVLLLSRHGQMASTPDDSVS